MQHHEWTSALSRVPRALTLRPAGRLQLEVASPEPTTLHLHLDFQPPNCGLSLVMAAACAAHTTVLAILGPCISLRISGLACQFLQKNQLQFS